MKRTKVRVHYGDRYGVKLWIPPETMFRIACERTEGMVGFFVQAAQHKRELRYIEALETFARSCYMQGLNDMIEACARLRVSVR